MARQKTDVSFKAFWDAYAYKRDRMAAERVWNRLPDKDKRAALRGITPYRDECQRTGVPMMYGVNYLRHRRWEDEISSPSVAAEKVQVQECSSSMPLMDDMETW